MRFLGSRIYGLQETVTDPSCLWTMAIWPGTPRLRSAEPPNQCGTLADGPSLHLRSVPTFAFAIVVVPTTVIGPEAAPLLEPQPALRQPTTANSTTRRQRASRAPQFPTIGSGMNARTSWAQRQATASLAAHSSAASSNGTSRIEKPPM
jgi:hypothetical protein